MLGLPLTRPTPPPRSHLWPQRSVGLLAVAGAAIVTAPSARWDVPQLVTVCLFTVISGLGYQESGESGVQISGSFLGLVLAGVLFGAAPAVGLAALSTLVTWIRCREAAHHFANNLLVAATSALIASTVFRAGVVLTSTQPGELGYDLLVFPAYMAALAGNFFGAVGYQCWLTRAPLVPQVRELFLPVLPAEMTAALLTMGAAWVAQRTGLAGLILLALVSTSFQRLALALLRAREHARRLERIATTDDLTGLPNRERFRDEVTARIATAGTAGFAVVLLDLDRFKEINDTLGHSYGDRVLQAVAGRLALHMADRGVAARLGGDEFALLATGRAAGRPDLRGLADDVRALVTAPIRIDDMELDVGLSIGIALCPEDGTDLDELLRMADVAMYDAKAAGTGVSLYRPEIDRRTRLRMGLIGEFRRAIDHGQLVLHYQPILETDGLRLRGFESLVRWEHPERGLLGPATFIPTVEQTDLIGPFTRYVLERAIAERVAWADADEDLWVAVNLSSRNLLDRDLPRQIARMLDAHGLSPAALKVEITETAMMTDVERVQSAVTGIRDYGIHVSVDDFGTGYSSLVNLRRMPISEVKIDRAFVSPMMTDENDLAVVRAMINLAHDLGIRTVAEGVEDGPTLSRLGAMACDLVQGFYMSRPLPPSEMAPWLEGSVVSAATAAAERLGTSGGGAAPLGRTASLLAEPRPTR